MFFWFVLNGIASAVIYTTNFFTTPKPCAFVIANEKKWSESYFNELVNIKAEWTPYLVWKCKPTQGKYINVDNNSIRATKNYHKSGIKIFMFGGSTMWGNGARDDYTIPSFVAHYLNEKGIVANITNYGETGHGSTQEVLKLLLLLREGKRPDYVIFYDGFNDTVGGYQSGVAGFPLSAPRRHQEFNMSRRYNKLGRAFTKATLQKFPVCFVVNDLLWYFRVKGSSVVKSRMDLDRQIVEKYLQNVSTVKQLAKIYGFKAFFYWQPTLESKTNRTMFEKTLFEEGFSYHNGLTGVYKVFKEKSPQGIVNLDDALKDHEGTLFYDWIHILEQGNGIIGKRMSGDIFQTIK
ncbi:SGNH/GDSL hydrolase family protein [Candidatus Uabimicrobium amorphum]|uniref:SGNH hydrolase-type esterase domain-containing protein n=1 Tax=Uabimicrobium amorphum TaxID=2596890 RepID=A0A5S9IP72_UABAM|nr:SGNH/GDSL hydrolase family protein [Candidatus Uabimicrobium amorphum]BBM85150.1 hypothetical protein UABAM_03513 [Candidatus Uabimicrobium amorphum]